jgi:phosphomevalonate kinase
LFFGQKHNTSTPQQFGWHNKQLLYDNGKMPKTGQPAKPIEQYEIIAIAGKQYSGKDTLAQLLLKRLPTFKQIPIAQAIKIAFAQQHGLTVEEVEAHKAEYRPGLIALGDWGRAQDPDYWLKQVLSQPGKKLISDVRLKREYDLLKAHGALLIRLEASREVRALRGQIVSEDDPTENELDTITNWDWVLVNHGSVADLEAALQERLRP